MLAVLVIVVVRRAAPAWRLSFGEGEAEFEAAAPKDRMVWRMHGKSVRGKAASGRS